MLLEIALNAGSVVLEGAVSLSRQDAAAPPAAPRVRARMLAHFMVRLYIALVCSYGEALADRIVSYRIATFCLISYRIYRFLLWLYRAITILAYVAFLALHVLHCVLLEIALNAGSACVGRRRPRGGVLSPTGSTSGLSKYCN